MFLEYNGYKKSVKQSVEPIYDIETIASLTMESMYNGMPDNLRDISVVKDENTNENIFKFNIAPTAFSNDDPWYLCPYGCRVDSSKVSAWTSKCEKTGLVHENNNNNVKSKIQVSRAIEYKDKNGENKYKIQYETINARRDCSSYMTVVLANLGLDTIWNDIDNAFKVENSNSSFVTDLELLSERDKEHFQVLPYSIENLQSGDIVSRSGHSELYIGCRTTTIPYDDNIVPEVLKYSWGSTNAVYKNIKLDSSTPNGYVFEAYQYQIDTRYNGKRRYQTIVRYIP